ncbi:MAG: hypothetical protein WC494_02570 [Candidatus Pacearchaeota archaeon]
MAGVSVSTINYFLPIFAFLLVFIVVYALLKKTEVLGGNEPVMIFVSLILASFFIVEASLVDFVRVSTGWVSVLIIVVFFVILIIGFLPGKEPLGFLSKSNWFAWVVLIALVVIFILSFGYIFHWTLQWSEVKTWFSTEWFGFILLLIIAAVVAVIIKKK